MAWHIEDLDERVGLAAISAVVDGLETYHFTLADRPVGELGFSAGP